MNKIMMLVNDKRNRGFFSYMQQVVCALHVADKKDIPLVINFSKGHAYQETNENVWDTYFYQPYGISLQEALILKNAGKIELIKGYFWEGDAELNDQVSENGIGYPWIKKAVRQRAAEVVKRVVPKEHLFNRIYCFYKKYLQNRWSNDINFPANMFKPLPKIIGVHKRGGISHMHGEPIRSCEDFFIVIDHLLTNYNFTKIFLATNQVEALEKFIDKYGNKLIYQPNITKLTGRRNLNIYQIPEINASNTSLANDVISDCFLLSKCDILLNTLSGIARWAQYLNPNLKHIFLNKAYYANHDFYGHKPKFEDDSTEFGITI